MGENQSCTHWLQLLQSGDEEAVARLWSKYFDHLLRLARRKLGAGPTKVADEEDVALSAFHSFCQGAIKGKFARLNDRDDLWQILAVITIRKAVRQRERDRALKRGGGKVRGESALRAHNELTEFGGIQDIVAEGPTAEFRAIAEEEFEQLLNLLPNDSLRQVALAKLEGFSNEEIAAQLSRHPRSVERKLQLIRKYWEASSD